MDFALQQDYELRRNQKLYKSELRLNEVQSTVYLASLLQVAWVTGVEETGMLLLGVLPMPLSW